MPEPPRLLGEIKTDPASPSLKDYDPARDRERMRGWPAVGLIVLLFIVVGFPIAAFLYGGFDASAEKVTTLVLAPVVGLVGTVLGFYFGSKDRG